MFTGKGYIVKIKSINDIKVLSDDKMEIQQLLLGSQIFLNEVSYMFFIFLYFVIIIFYNEYFNSCYLYLIKKNYPLTIKHKFNYNTSDLE